jgi:peptidoglycan/xylan/chitin deacetylase (PgdA/CDA1 family)
LLSLAPATDKSADRAPNPERTTPSLRDRATRVFCGFYKYSGAMAVQERLAFRAGRRFAAILLFHRVTDEIPRDGLTIGTTWFRSICRLLRDQFDVVSLGELHGRLSAPDGPPRRTVAITFDDCYHDNLAAARVLADHGLPACFFIPTQYVGTDHVFHWDRGLKPMRNLGWDDVHEMARLGHDIGSHTVHHADLGILSPEDTRRELEDSKKSLETRLGRAVRWFAYPFGGRENFRAEHLPLVRAAGYDACFSGFGGFVRPEMLGGALPRMPIPYFRSLLHLEAHLSGCLDWCYGLNRRLGI